jgi:hypothetical protein
MASRKLREGPPHERRAIRGFATGDGLINQLELLLVKP